MGKIEEGLVSIIIPVFNRELLLPVTLESILSQTYTKWECIIVDDWSTDSSLSVAMGYAAMDSRIKVISRPWYKRKGANTCRNIGFQFSSGEFIHWFDSDDIMNFEMLAISINLMQQKDCEMCVVSAAHFDGNISKINSANIFSNKQLGDNPAFDFFTVKYFFQTSQVLFRRSKLCSFKMHFNPKLKRNQETEFFIRLLLDNVKLLSVNEILVYIRSHSDSITARHLILDNSEKYLKDFDAYQLIFKSFKNSKYFTPNVVDYFSAYFFKSLKKSRTTSYTYFKIYLFGNIYRLFPSLYLSTKIFLVRMFINV
jgi:GalNAc5-diNAcBac-PP-undecaprenol beta-1,3-glucosyltransferase